MKILTRNINDTTIEIHYDSTNQYLIGMIQNTIIDLIPYKKPISSYYALQDEAMAWVDESLKQKLSVS
jgi:hypothetical protein|tara:strand:- start:335 stop:538 length:204 start_codon:yes stop_codon:yes gene_type:complete